MAVRKRPRKDGSTAWTCYWRNGDRRRHAQAFDTKDAALLHESRMRIASRSVRRVQCDPEITIADYSERWLKLKAPTLKETTLKDYRDRLRLHIVPELGPIKVRLLERGRIHELLADKVRAGLNRKTARRILANVHSMLEHAKHDRVIDANPASGLARFAGLTETKDQQQEQIQAFTREELDRFLAAAATKRPAFWIVAFVGSRLGARLGEILGVRWSDIDWTARTVRLSRAITPKGRITTLKTKAARTVELGQVVADLLRQHRTQLEEDFLRMGLRWHEGYAIFPALGGAAVTHSAVNVAFKACLKAAGLPGHYSYHSLRHSFASIHLSEGTPIQWVSQQLGHADIRTTYNVYGRWLKARAEGASDALDSVPWQQEGNTGASVAVGAEAKSLTGLVRPARFERATYRFVVCRSIQLS